MISLLPAHGAPAELDDETLAAVHPPDVLFVELAAGGTNELLRSGDLA